MSLKSEPSVFYSYFISYFIPGTAIMWVEIDFLWEKNFAAFFVLQGDKLLIWSHLQCDTHNLLCLIWDKIILKKFTHVDMYWEILGNY